MNTPVQENDDDLRYAEYVLGVLDVDARAAVALDIESSPAAAAAVAVWERNLLPLAEEVVDVAPAPYVWARISDALKLNAPDRVAPRKGLWNNLQLWHWIGIGASVVAIASVMFIVTPPRPSPAPVSVSAGYMVSNIQQDNGVTAWTATIDLQNARMVVVPASPTAFEQGRAPELWLIPLGQKPISVGMIMLIAKHHHTGARRGATVATRSDRGARRVGRADRRFADRSAHRPCDRQGCDKHRTPRAGSPSQGGQSQPPARQPQSDLNGRVVAVVGSGISGLASAWLLSRKHEVTLLEANNYLGGHTHMQIPRRPNPLHPSRGVNRMS